MQNYFGNLACNPAQQEQLISRFREALACHMEGDYQGYLEYTTKELASQLDAEKFAHAHDIFSKQLGQLEQLQFLASLKRGEDPMLVFKALFTVCADDILIHVTFDNHSNPALIKWLWIE